MIRKLSRRFFMRTAAASAGTLLLSSCGKNQDNQLTATIPDSGVANPPATPSLAESLPRALFLDLLDGIADTKMRQCHHCAQASFLSLQEGFELEGGPIVKALTPLPGIAERGETCGAVIGSLMALGLVFGRDRIDDWAGWRSSLIPARAFCSRFEEELGSTRCGDLLEKYFGKRYNLADPVELAEFQAADPNKICGHVVRTAVRVAAEIILEPPSEKQLSPDLP